MKEGPALLPVAVASAQCRRPAHKTAGVSVSDYFADYFIIASGTRRDPDYVGGSARHEKIWQWES